MAHIVQQAYAVNAVGVNIARAKFWAGRTGYIMPDTSLGDTPFPKIYSGESLSARAHIDDFTFVPVNGQRVQFYMNRNSAGDKIAISIAAL